MGISVLTARRSRAAGAVAGALVVVPGVLTALALTPASASAPAAVTPVSTVYKTGTDPTTGSTASSPGTPGDPAGSTGVTQPGDTVNWAVSYQNNTGTNASVNITDPLTAAGAYVPGSLQLPPNPDGAQPFAAQYSTDDGATWQPGTPPAGATGVGLTGTFPPTTQQQSVNPAAPRSINLTNSAGDGYNAVTSADGSLVYAVFHHNNTNTAVFCASSSGGLCPGWPAGSNTTATFVSPIAGTPIGTGTNGGLTTGIQNGTFLAGGNLYWVAQQITAVSGRYPVGVMCLNLTTLQSCGFTQLDSVLAGPAGGTSGQISGTGIAASDGQYYYLDSDGNLLCFSPSAGACGVIATVSPTAGSMPASYTYGNIILGQIQRAGASTYSLTCYNVTTGSSCPGYPISPTAPPSPAPYASGHVAPVLNSAGTLIGACVMNNAASYGCWSLTGAPVNNPYPATGAGSTTNETGDALALGTRVYLPVSSDNAVGCYDFAGYTETGKVPACTGFTPAANPSNYTVRPMTGNTACLLADGDGKKISSFDAFTGGPCSSTTATETVSPVDYYCGSGTAGFLAWNQLAITGAPAGSYTEAEVSLTGADGNPVAGFTGVVLAPGKTLNLSSIPVTAPTSQLTAQVTLHSATAAVTAAQVSLSWAGDVPQMCFQTTAPPVPCGQSAAVTNNATAVTTGAGGSDAPKGDSSGNATFTSAPAADACSLDIIKTASPAEARPGGTVTYTVTVRNTGTAAYAASDPAQFSDDLTGVLADAAYNNDASASTGTVSYTAPALSWSGDLAAGPAPLSPTR